jgi:hypothetical protein
MVITDEWYVAGPDRAAVRNPLAPPPAKVLDQLVAYGYDPTLEPGW